MYRERKKSKQGFEVTSIVGVRLENSRIEGRALTDYAYSCYLVVNR